MNVDRSVDWLAGKGKIWSIEKMSSIERKESTKRNLLSAIHKKKPNETTNEDLCICVLYINEGGFTTVEKFDKEKTVGTNNDDDNDNDDNSNDDFDDDEKEKKTETLEEERKKHLLCSGLADGKCNCKKGASKLAISTKHRLAY
ncbi:hypothetical protein DINM_000169 [Dirofilaria immitis]|nr:hypothetical protein [Dirofilaria immitis]